MIIYVLKREESLERSSDEYQYFLNGHKEKRVWDTKVNPGVQEENKSIILLWEKNADKRFWEVKWDKHYILCLVLSNGQITADLWKQLSHMHKSEEQIGKCRKL